MVNYSCIIGDAMVLIKKPSVIESPSDRVPEKVPRWDLTGTEACGGGKVLWWMLLMLGEYMRIYSAGIRSNGVAWDPQAQVAPSPHWGLSCQLVAPP